MTISEAIETPEARRLNNSIALLNKSLRTIEALRVEGTKITIENGESEQIIGVNLLDEETADDISMTGYEFLDELAAATKAKIKKEKLVLDAFLNKALAES